MKHELIFHPHDTLRAKAAEVKAFGDILARLLADMLMVMNKKKGVGIAAPQVGQSLRCFHARDGETVWTFVNPVIIASSPQTAVHEEGCLSIPGVYADVVRPAAISVEAKDAKGKLFRMDAEGFFARVVQHEFDHLDGVLFIDRLSPAARRVALKAYVPPKNSAGQRGDE